MPALSTFLACLALGVELGLAVGVVVDVCFLLYFNARPDISIQRETLQDTVSLIHIIKVVIVKINKMNENNLMETNKYGNLHV